MYGAVLHDCVSRCYYTAAICVRALKGFALLCASHPGEIALNGKHSMLATVVALFAHTAVTAAIAVEISKLLLCDSLLLCRPGVVCQRCSHWRPVCLMAHIGYPRNSQRIGNRYNRLMIAQSSLLTNYNAVLLMQRREMFLREAHDVYAELKRCGFTPDRYTLNSMVSALAAGNAVSQACALILLIRDDCLSSLTMLRCPLLSSRLKHSSLQSFRVTMCQCLSALCARLFKRLHASMVVQLKQHCRLFARCLSKASRQQQR